MEALAEITSERHEMCCRGGDITAGTQFPAVASCRIVVRTRGFVTSYLVRPSCRAHSHAVTNDLTHSPRNQIHRTRRTYTFQSMVQNPVPWRSAGHQGPLRHGSLTSPAQWPSSRNTPGELACTQAATLWAFARVTWDATAQTVWPRKSASALDASESTPQRSSDSCRSCET